MYLRSGLGLALALLTFVVTLPGLPQVAAAQSDANYTYTEEMLQSFAEARAQVQRIREEYIPRIEDAQTRQQAQQLQQTANARMVQAINAAGLDVPTYNEIAESMRANSELRARVQQLMAQMDP